ncbi:hypothetical protein [Trichormus sp. NMC-1]|uniref:hypothetical protein n=1 Tax=Trichormus sp. NMC-1 TaxID=1853259 RepID=UPI0008DBF2F1|nr:hypothetical protein [Trichormus sp. NMC-1]
MFIKQTKLTDTKAEQLKGGAKRRFIAQTVVALGKGGQSLAARELGWNRVTIGKGIKELTNIYKVSKRRN